MPSLEFKGLNNPQQLNVRIEYLSNISTIIQHFNIIRFFFFLGVILFYLILYSKLKFRFKHEIKIDEIYFLNCSSIIPHIYQNYLKRHSKYLSKYKTDLILYLYIKATFMAMNAY